LDENLPGRSQRLTRSHSCSRARKNATATCIALAPAAFHDKGVDLKRRPPKSLPAAPLLADRLLSKLDPRLRTRRAGTPPSTFLFLPIHVSNSPEPRRFQIPPVNRRAVEAQGFRLWIGSLVTDISEELRRRADAPSGGVPNGELFRRQPPKCQPPPAGGKIRPMVQPRHSRVH
jgi:hypothetical protein